MKRRSSTVVLGLLQTACSPNPEANLKKTLRAAERAAKDGAQILCTQELFRSQNFCQSEDNKYFALAEPSPLERVTKAPQKIGRFLELPASNRTPSTRERRFAPSIAAPRLNGSARRTATMSGMY